MDNNQSNIQSSSEKLTVSEKAEQSVLGAILLNNDSLTEVAGVLTFQDFYYNAHQIIYSAMLELYKKAEPVDFITLTEKIRPITNLEDVGGYSYIASLPSVIDYTKNIDYYAQIVKEKSRLRQVIQACNQIISTAQTGKSVEEVLEISEKTMFDIAQDSSSKNLRHIKDVLMSTYEVIEENYKNKGSMTGLDTGFTDLNFMTNGFQRTDLIVVGARPAVGKTAFALNIAHNAEKKGAKVAVFSLEMADTQLALRILAAECKVELSKLKSGELEEADWLKLVDSISVIAKNPVYINQTANINLMEIRSQCRKLKMQKGLDLIVIDYIQLMLPESNSENRQQEISKISRGLKILAKELDCTIMALSQVSRASEIRANHRPMLSDLRESGAIEQDADIVMFLYRDELFNPDTEDKNLTEVIIAKHRSGEIGTVKLVWSGKYQLLLNAER